MRSRFRAVKYNNSSPSTHKPKTLATLQAFVKWSTHLMLKCFKQLDFKAQFFSNSHFNSSLGVVTETPVWADKVRYSKCRRLLELSKAAKYRNSSRRRSSIMKRRCRPSVLRTLQHQDWRIIQVAWRSNLWFKGCLIRLAMQVTHEASLAHACRIWHKLKTSSNRVEPCRHKTKN